MKIVFDKELCERHGQCRGAAPELFAFGADGSLVILDESPPEALREALQDALDLCPRQALSIQD